MDDAPTVSLHVDEGVHDAIGIIVVAFVFSKASLADSVSKSLRNAGLEPGIDEFKSGSFMAGNVAQRKLREELMEIAGHGCRVALAVCPVAVRPALGVWCLEILDTLIKQNGFRETPIEAHFDQGMFRSKREAEASASGLAALRRVILIAEEDSKLCLGIQVADVVAHCFAQVLREEITGNRKIVAIVGPDTGYADDDSAALGWTLKMSLRHSLLRRQVLAAGTVLTSEMDPRVAAPNEDLVDLAQNPDVLGWGAFAHPALTPEIRDAVEAQFSSIWLGCIH